jgi:uncharacterized protein YjbJ (UPF0337 family)
MNEDRIKGTVRDVGGKVQESFGRGIGDAGTQVEGVTNQLKGKAQDLYGQAKDSASDMAANMADSARETGSSFERQLRNTIEHQPYAAVGIALGIGWLLGRSHRPV